ncbi:KptA family-domain-containing protein [Fomes fomentarius]|nr:KptA family-domain-containing protein [Fomes fomentarius]
MASDEADIVLERQQRRQEKDRKHQPRQNTGDGGRGGGRGGGGGKGGGPAKLRGLPKDSHDVRISKTLSWILRHGSQSEGLVMRKDGYLSRPKLRELNFGGLQEIVKNDAKGRYNLVLEAGPNTGDEGWWIRANQGHSMKSVVLDLEPINSQADIPTGIAVHGTTKRAWESIKEQGLSKMTRNHIHLAQGVGSSNVISGMRKSSEILVYVDVQKAINAGVKFYLSANGVVLTEGDEQGFLLPQFFSRVETAARKPLPEWEGPASAVQSPSSTKVSATIATDGEADLGRSGGIGSEKKDEEVRTSLQELEQKVASTTL